MGSDMGYHPRYPPAGGKYLYTLYQGVASTGLSRHHRTYEGELSRIQVAFT